MTPDARTAALALFVAALFVAALVALGFLLGGLLELALWTVAP